MGLERMDTQDLMPKPDWVVCIDTARVPLAAETDYDQPIGSLLADNVAVLPRTPLLEQACRYKQLVVYVVVTQRGTDGVNRTLVYQRKGKQEGEQRLAGKFSIGVGGHVEVRDFAPDMEPLDTARPYVTSDSLEEACLNAALRELDEELLWPTLAPTDSRPDLVMFTNLHARLYTPQDQVGRAHIGLVYACELPDGHEVPTYGPGTQTLWLSEAELAAFDLNSCETWTRVLLQQDYDHTLKRAPGEPSLAELLAAGVAVKSNSPA
jgi:predicted NUDIX family phosphoesterase